MPSEPALPAPDRPRRVPRALWAITALHVGLMLVFSLLYPPFTGFDETQHVDAVLSIRHGDGWPAPTERELSQGIVAVAEPVLLAASDLPFSDDELTEREQRPSVAELGVEQDSVGQLLPNQITQHPPLYYAAQAAVLAAIPGSVDWPFDLTVGVLRLGSILLMAPLPLLAWATARALRTSRLVGLSAALLVLSVPQLQRVGGSVNNDAAYTLAFAAAVVLLVRVARGELGRRSVVLTGLVVGVALLTKGFALVLPLAIALAFLAGGRRTGDRRWWVPALLCETVAFVVGGWWWLRNLVLYGTVQPSGWPDTYRQVLELEPREPGEPAPVTRFLVGSWSRLTERFWGGLEINYIGPDTFPHWLTNLLAVSAAVAVAVAVVAARRSRVPLFVGALVPFAATVGLVTYGIWTGYSYSLDFPGAQGRYLFGSVPSLAVAVALGLAVALRGARRLLPLLVTVLALGMQAAGLYSVLRRSWLPVYDGRPRVDRYAEALDGILDWAPWPPALTGAMLVATTLSGALVLVLAARAALVHDDGPLVEAAPDVRSEPLPV